MLKLWPGSGKLLSAALLLSACETRPLGALDEAASPQRSDAGNHRSDQGLSSLGPRLEVLPRQLNLGLVSVIAPTRRNIALTNVGDEPLRIIRVVVDTGGLGFSSPDAGPETLLPGASILWSVQLAAGRGAEGESSILIESNDPATPIFELRLTASGSSGRCRFGLDPVPLQLPAVPWGETSSRTFTILNAGPTDCLLTQLKLGEGPFRLARAPALPAIVPGPGRLSVSVLFRSAEPGVFDTALEVVISSGTSPFSRVPVQGEAY